MDVNSPPNTLFSMIFCNFAADCEAAASHQIQWRNLAQISSPVQVKVSVKQNLAHPSTLATDKLAVGVRIVNVRTTRGIKSEDFVSHVGSTGLEDFLVSTEVTDVTTPFRVI
ncbi:hypothetical protein RUM43_009500 [Polyplax serrata]|uniref:Uncharacterized protein n=1 Tax=Polyplax serrata TaxID=468196 RepID=A0AAN8PII7_POLSC